MVSWIESSLDWLPLIGTAPFAAKVVVVWILLGMVSAGFYAISLYLEPIAERHNASTSSQVGLFATALGGFVIMCIGVLSILPVSIVALAAMAPEPPPPVAASSTPIKDAGKMNKEVIRIKGEGRRATVVLYGKREDDSFRVIGYRARIIGSEINRPGSWSLALPSSFRHSGYSVDSATPIRPDGKWQWGYSTQEGVFSSGATYEFSFDFDSDDRFEGGVGFPISF